MTRHNFPIALTIAGSDPSGGAGIQADLKTFHQHGVYGAAVITLLTAQNTREVRRVDTVSTTLLTAQLDSVLTDINPSAIKTGALGNVEIVEAVAHHLTQISAPFILDPVMISKHGSSLIDDRAIRLLCEKLIPLATLLTPNIPEAARLLSEIGKFHDHIGEIAWMENAAHSLTSLGCKAVLIKGGHRNNDPTDVLFVDGEPYRLAGKHVLTKHTHGTGCVLSAAITAQLARGASLIESVHVAKKFVAAALEHAPDIGSGIGPLDLFVPVDGC